MPISEEVAKLALKLTWDVALYFYGDDVIDFVADEGNRFLIAAGEYISESARGSILEGHLSSPPGQPPRSHTGQIKNLIYYALDPTDMNAVKLQRGVTIGPIRRSHGSYTVESWNAPIPAILEHGGQSFVRKKRDGQRKHGRKPEVKRVHVAPRPYMGPALRKAEERVPELWQKSRQH